MDLTPLVARDTRSGSRSSTRSGSAVRTLPSSSAVGTRRDRRPGAGEREAAAGGRREPRQLTSRSSSRSSTASSQMLAHPVLRRGGVSVGDTTLVLRTPVVPIPAGPAGGLRPPASAAAPAPPPATSGGAPSAGTRACARGRRPSRGCSTWQPRPGAAAYVKVGGEVIAGRLIGLLEAMKLFNEIKSDVTGVVRRIVTEPGALVKTHQVLIEVEPT